MKKSEFEPVFQGMRKEYPLLNKTLAWNLLCRFEDCYTENKRRAVESRHAFGFLIRMALNDTQIGDPQERQHYASLISAIYNNRKRFAPKAHRSGKRKVVAAPPYDVAVSEKGQLEWKL
jgi:hypothetical protein